MSRGETAANKNAQYEQEEIVATTNAQHEQGETAATNNMFRYFAIIMNCFAIISEFVLDDLQDLKIIFVFVVICVRCLRLFVFYGISSEILQ